MDRKDELLSIIPEDTKPMVREVVDEIVFLEDRLTELKKLPFISVNPKNAMQQRNTPAAKLYKEFLQQYINCVKMVEYVIYKDKRLDAEDVEDSPLRRWFNANIQR